MRSMLPVQAAMPSALDFKRENGKDCSERHLPYIRPSNDGEIYQEGSE